MNLIGDWLWEWDEIPGEEIWEELAKEFGGGLHAGNHEFDGSGTWVYGDGFLSQQWTGIDTPIHEVPGGSGACIASVNCPCGGIASAVFGKQGVMVVDDFETGVFEDLRWKDPVVIGADDERWPGEVFEESCEFGCLFGFCELAANFAGGFFEEGEGGLICEDCMQMDACVCEQAEAIAGNSAAANDNGIGKRMVICHG